MNFGGAPGLDGDPNTKARATHSDELKITSERRVSQFDSFPTFFSV